MISNITKIYIYFGVTILICIGSFIQISMLQNKQAKHQEILNERKLIIDHNRELINDLIIRITILEKIK